MTDDGALPVAWERAARSRSRLWDSVIVSLSDGRILHIGDETVGEVFDPKTNTWSPTGPHVVPCRERALVACPDGSALATGGEAEGRTVADCESFDPVTGCWRSAPALPEPRHRHAGVVSRGRVFVIGGYGEREPFFAAPVLGSMVSWSPGETTWRTMPALPRALECPRALVLVDDSIIVWDSGGNVARWDHERWSEIGEIHQDAAVVALPTGGLAAIGGRDAEGARAEVELWSPSGGWRRGPDLPTPRQKGCAIVLQDGTLALLGGEWTRQSYEDTSTGGELDWEYRSFKRWIIRDFPCEDALVEDPGLGWRSVPAPDCHVVVPHLLDDSRVLVISGFDYLLLWTP